MAWTNATVTVECHTKDAC